MKYRFRLRIIVSVVIIGCIALWASYYVRAVNEQNAATQFINSTVRRQAQSIAEFVSALNLEDIDGLITRANNVGARVIQNENILSENSRYRGVIPNISIENMNTPVFNRVRDTLIRSQDAITRAEKFVITGDTYNIFPKFLYILDRDGGSGVVSTHTARVLSSSFLSESHDNRVLWLGLYIRGSDALAYDRIFEGDIISGPLLDSDEQYFAGAPLYRDGQTVIGALVLEYDIADTLAEIRQRSRGAIIWYVATSALYALLIIVFASIFFRPLKWLLHNAMRLQDNDLNSKAFLKSNDEFNIIGDSMDTITERLDSAVYNIESINRVSSSLFPSAYLKLLDKENIGELEAGEYTERYVSILSIQVNCPDILERSFFSSNELVELINDTVQYVGRMLDKNAGFIETFTSHELLLFFPRNADLAIGTAKAIQQGALKWNEERMQNGKASVSFNMALHRGMASFSIVGENEFVKPYATSDAIEITKKLSMFAKKLHSPIIVTDNFNKNIVKALHYQFRYLGAVLLGLTKPIQILEEIDTYPDDVKKMIVATRIDFEEGVKSFERNYTRRAQRIFDSLAERNPQDAVVASFRENVAKNHAEKR